VISEFTSDRPASRMFNRLQFRIAALVTSGLCVVAATEAWQVSLETGSMAARIAAAAVAGFGVWVGLSAFLPVLVTGPLRRIRPLERLWRNLERLDEQDRGRRQTMVGLAAALAIWGATCFAANVFGHALAPPPVSVDDQGAYLQRAEWIKRPEGALYTFPSLFSDMRSGRYREANRHPLYLAFLSIRPDESWGRSLSWSFGIAGLLTGTWMVWRRFSPLAAGIFAILVGLNFNLGQFSVMVVCETLLIWIVSLSYFVLLPPYSASRSLGRRRLRIFLASFLLGLAYMTKGTGLVFFVVFVVWLAWVSRPRRSDVDIPDDVEEQAVISLTEAYPFRQWIIAMMLGLIGFVMVSAPLLERNMRLYGNPFYNVNTLLLFADDYSQFENMLMGGVTPEEAAESFFNRHTIGQLIDRELRGLVWEAFIMLRTLGPQGLDDGRVLFGAPIALCAAIGLWFERRPAKWLLINWILVSWIMFAWYVPIAAGDRFPIPLLLPVLGHAADGMARLLKALRMPSVAVPVPDAIERVNDGLAAERG
jgi:hypothetical protein